MASAAEQLAANFNFGNLGKAHELRQRIFFTLGALIVARLGTYIPMPGIDPAAIAQQLQQQGGGLLDVFNVLAGGAVNRMAIFALGIMPYISASIIIQLMTTVFPELEALKKEGEAGRKVLNQYTRYGTVLLAAVQAYGIAVGLEGFHGTAGSAVMDPGIFFRLTAVVTLVGGSVFLMWLGEQITPRGILVQYPKRQVGNRMFGGDSSHLPLKLNTSGVIPPIFASSLLLLPATVAGFSGQSTDRPAWLTWLSNNLAHGQPLYMSLYVALIAFFAFFYTAIVFNPAETADNLKKYGGFIPGIRPGKNTADYLDYVLTRLTAIGALYLAVICALPELLISQYSVPFYFGGTSLLIVVSVTMDTVAQIHSHLLAHQYEGLIKKAKLRGRR